MNILKFRLDDWKVFKNIFNNIFEIIDEVVVVCDDTGLTFNGIDRSHICFFEGSISKEFFDEYEVDDVLLIYIDLVELINVLKRGKSKDKMLFEANHELYTIKFKDKNTRTFSTIQLDNVDNSKTPPALDYSAHFKCDFDSIKNTLEDADLYSEKLTFSCDDGVLRLSCDGNSGNYENICQLDEYDGDSCVATYSVTKLLKIFKNKLNSKELSIHMGEDYPMMIEMGVENIKMNYLLAPVLSNE